MTARVYASRRKRLVDALVDKLKTINGQGAFLTDVGEKPSNACVLRKITTLDVLRL